MTVLAMEGMIGGYFGCEAGIWNTKSPAFWVGKSAIFPNLIARNSQKCRFVADLLHRLHDFAPFYL